MSQPFGLSDGSKITVNPSFAAVKPLTETVHATPSGHKVHFSTQEIAVSYNDVTDVVPTLHDQGYQYIIHFGVGRNGFITLERRAHSGGYYGTDINGRNGPLEGSVVHVTKWDVEKLLNGLKSLGYNVYLSLVSCTVIDVVGYCCIR
jgi:hypothetical protein